MFKSGLIIIYLFSLHNNIVFGRQSTFVNLGGGLICPRERRGLEICLKDAINVFIPQLGLGVNAYGVPPCEPLIIPEVNLEQNRGPITLVSKYRDITVRGPSKMKVKSIEIDRVRSVLKANLIAPIFKIKGLYKMTGYVMMMPIEADGLCEGTYSNINSTVTIQLERVVSPDAGRDLLGCRDLQVDFSVGSSQMYMDNLFGHDEIGELLNRYINENWSLVSEEFKPVVEKSLRDFIKPLVDKVFETLYADDILGEEIES